VVANVCCFVAFMYFLAVAFKKIFREGCHENLAMKIGLVYILMTFRSYWSLSYWNGTVHCTFSHWESHWNENGHGVAWERKWDWNCYCTAMWKERESKARFPRSESRTSSHHNCSSETRSTLFLHGVCMLRECICGECAHEQHVITLTLTHTITAYSVSGNVVRVHILICATRQKPCRKKSLPKLPPNSSPDP